MRSGGSSRQMEGKVAAAERSRPPLHRVQPSKARRAWGCRRHFPDCLRTGLLPPGESAVEHVGRIRKRSAPAADARARRRWAARAVRDAGQCAAGRPDFRARAISRMQLSAQELERFLSDGGLSRVAGRLAASARPAIGLVPVRTAEDRIPLGGSKLGGRPDLLPETPWPAREGCPLGFLAQINLGAVPRAAWLEELLPSSGLLSFFYDLDQNAWGFLPEDRGSWRVLYIPDNLDRLARREPPEAERNAAPFASCRLDFCETVSLPDWSHLHRYGITLTDAEFDLYVDLREEVGGDGRGYFYHRLFGHPDVIQGDEMELECELTSSGVLWRTPQAKALEPRAVRWCLLLQLDSERDAGMNWVDFGILYFWIPREDLIRRHFDDVWMLLQST